MKPKLAVTLVLGSLLVILLVQNSQVVRLRFLFWEVQMSRIILLLLTLLVGFFSGFLAAKLSGRR